MRRVIGDETKERVYFSEGNGILEGIKKRCTLRKSFYIIMPIGEIKFLILKIKK